MSLKPKPQSWDDVRPGDVITWTETKWSHRLGRNTERPRRLVVRKVYAHGLTRHADPTVRPVAGILVTKGDRPHKTMNKYPLTNENNVGTGEMGFCKPIALSWITSLERPAYALVAGGKCPAGHTDIVITDGGTCATCEQPEPSERYEVVKLYRDSKWHVFDTQTHAEVTLAGLDTKREALALVEELRKPEAVPATKPVKLTDVQWSAINHVSGLECRGYFSSYAIKTNTSAALVGKGLITHIIHIGGFGRQWLTREGFKAAGIDLDTVVAEAHMAALEEYGKRGGGPLMLVEYAKAHREELDTEDAQVHAYARDVEVAGPKFPKGTPEYEAYATELHAELEKFAKGEAPYEYGPIDKAAVLTNKPIDSLMNSGAVEYTKRDDAVLQMDLALGRADRKALPIVPPVPRTLRELINAYANATGERPKLRAEIERRFNLAAGLMPVEVRQILDGRV
ncbi:MAG TPA: hypothetical protein VGP91_04290 [Actinoplanes sp.]|nr:hypothetical protein [Actinoplanes sp.]